MSDVGGTIKGWLDELNGEMAVKDRRIAELETELNHYRTNGAEQRYWEGRWRDADKRIAELEAVLGDCEEFLEELLLQGFDTQRQRMRDAVSKALKGKDSAG